ncbi:MAG: hypothetical protein ACO4B3_09100 [Planctomycetota bacterium]
MHERSPLKLSQARPRALLRLLPVLLLLGCGPVVDPDGERLFLSGDERGAMEAFRRRLEEPSRREALDRNLLGTAALCGGDLATARRELIDAGRIMGSFPAPQRMAMVGSEGSKLYLGDPYEGGMNALYTAYACLAEGDAGNARAALKSGILTDSDSGKDEYRSDVAGLFLLEAWLALRNGQSDLARQDLEKVQELLPDCPLADPDRLREANTLLLIDVGEGPRKVRRGRHGEAVGFTIPEPPARELALTIGDRAIRPALGVDVGFQARTRGGRAMDRVLAGKANVKEIGAEIGVLLIEDARVGRADAEDAEEEERWDRQAIVGGGLILVASMIRPEADTRHWHLLPGATWLWIGKIPEGLHHLHLEFRDGEGQVLPALEQRWHHLPFTEGGLNTLYLRAGPRRGFGHAPAPEMETAP